MKKSFEDCILTINQEINKRRGKWQLKAISWMDFDDVAQILRIHLQDVIHARERHDDPAAPRQRAPRKPRARAPSDQGRLVADGQLHDLHDVVLAAWKNDAIRTALFH